MKKFALSLVFLALLAALTGCPNQATDDQAPIDATQQVQVDPNDQVGGFSIDCRLFDDVADKSLSDATVNVHPPFEVINPSVEKGGPINTTLTDAQWDAIVDKQSRRVTELKLYLYSMDDQPQPGEDPYWAPRYNFELGVRNGVASTQAIMGLLAGAYQMDVYFMNGGHPMQLFTAFDMVTIWPGQIKAVTLEAYLYNRFPVNFGLQGYPPVNSDEVDVYANIYDADWINWDCGGKLVDSGGGYPVVQLNVPYDIKQPVYIDLIEGGQPVVTIPAAFDPLFAIDNMVIVNVFAQSGGVTVDVNWHRPNEVSNGKGK